MATCQALKNSQDSLLVSLSDELGYVYCVQGFSDCRDCVATTLRVQDQGRQDGEALTGFSDCVAATTLRVRVQDCSNQGRQDEEALTVPFYWLHHEDNTVDSYSESITTRPRAFAFIRYSAGRTIHISTNNTITPLDHQNSSSTNNKILTKLKILLRRQ